jgi:CRP-like cAMP-binding protein
MNNAELNKRLERMRLIRELPDPMRNAAIRLFLDVSKARTVPDGSVLFEVGDVVGDRGYVLVDGTVSIEKADRPMLEVTAPELLGELKQLDPGHRRTATVKAVGNVAVLKFDWGEFFTAAAQIFSEDQMKALRTGLEQVAWSHIAE